MNRRLTKAFIGALSFAAALSTAVVFTQVMLSEKSQCKESDSICTIREKSICGKR